MKYVCSICGYVHEGDNAPAACPQCKAPASKFSVQAENNGEIKFACEHFIGGHDNIDPEVREGLKAHFMGECTEVGMYLAMSRQADRQGYPEIAGECGFSSADYLGKVVSEVTGERALALRRRETDLK